MLRPMCCVLLCVVALACHAAEGPGKADRNQVPAGVTFEGGDGSSYEKAVLIKGAKEESGVRAEYAWIAQKFPKSMVKSQALRGNKGRQYDVLVVATADGATQEVFFDITEFFGKF